VAKKQAPKIAQQLNSHKYAKRSLLGSEADICVQRLDGTGDEGRAIREANAAVAKDFAKSIVQHL
jgi:hypothetical protein